MNKDRPVLNGVIMGLGVGLVLMLLKRGGISTGFVVPTCLGIFAAFIIFLCFQPLLRQAANNKLMKKGIDGEAEIMLIEKSLVHPKYYVDDGQGNPVLPADMTGIPIAYTLKLQLKTEKFTCDYETVTTPKTKEELEPYSIYVGAKIPIKYLESDPSAMMLNIPAFAENDIPPMGKRLFFAFVVAAIYAAYLIFRVF